MSAGDKANSPESEDLADNKANYQIREKLPEDLRLVESPEESADKSDFSRSDQVDEMIGRMIGGNFEIESCLGEGGLGVVYRARDVLLDRVVALKVLKLSGRSKSQNAALERAQREVKATIEFQHPNIVSVRHFSVDEGRAYIVMEFIDGEPLNEILSREGPLEPERALRLIRQLALALDYSHSRKVVHRDIKPHNLMIQSSLSSDAESAGSSKDSEQLKVIDFGILKLTDLEESRNLTQSGEFIGTVNYMSPEQCRGEKVDNRSDLYSLGCVLYEMLTGSVPHAGSTAMEVMLARTSNPAPVLKPVPGYPGLSAVLARLLDPVAAKRYSAASELIDDLDKLIGGRVPVATSTRVAGARMMKSAYKFSLVSIIIVALLSLALLVALSTGSDIGSLTRQLEKEPGNPELLRLRSQAFQYKGMYPQALIDMNSILERNPEDIDALFDRAEIYLRMSRYKEAARDFKGYLERHPDSFIGWTRLACSQVRGTDYEDAIASADKAISLLGKNGADPVPKKGTYRAWEYRANAYLALGEYDKALADSNLVAEFNPSAYITRAYCYFEKGNFAAAKSDVSAYLSRNPNDAYALVMQGRLYQQDGDFSAAMNYYEMAINTNDLYFAHWYRLRCLIEMGDLTRAREEIEIVRQRGIQSSIKAEFEEIDKMLKESKKSL